MGKLIFDKASYGNLGPSGARYVACDWKENIFVLGAKTFVRGQMMRQKCKLPSAIMVAKKLSGKTSFRRGFADYC